MPVFLVRLLYHNPIFQLFALGHVYCSVRVPVLGGLAFLLPSGWRLSDLSPSGASTLSSPVSRCSRRANPFTFTPSPPLGSALLSPLAVFYSSLFFDFSFLLVSNRFCRLSQRRSLASFFFRGSRTEGLNSPFRRFLHHNIVKQNTSRPMSFGFDLFLIQQSF